MILFCDTSALVKIYVAESGSMEVRKLVADSEAVAACRIAWAEAHAALARRVREVPADAEAVDKARRGIARDWPRYLLVEISQDVVERAAEYAETFALRGYDSVQLAAAHTLALKGGQPVSFACFDDRLNKAAKVLAMQTPFGSSVPTAGPTKPRPGKH